MPKNITLGFNYEATRFEPFVIFAVTKATQDAKEQGQRNAEFALWLIENGIKYKQLLGSYEGQTEVSWLIRNQDFIDNFDEFNVWVKGQESILLLDAQEPYREGRRPVELIYSVAAGNHAVNLGFWTNVTKDEALTQDAWTYDPAFEEYYIAKP